jgi:hypothetical protein
MRGLLSIGVLLLLTTLGGLAVADSTESAPTISQLVRRSLANESLWQVQPLRLEADNYDPSLAKLELLRTSIVARDWHGAFAVSGEGSLLSDSFRLTRSSRMMIGRVTFGNWRVMPYAHVGLGEWRIDRDFLPLSQANQEFASQFS